MATYDFTSDNPVINSLLANDIIQCTGAKGQEVEIMLPAGTYKLECWGAQGGYRSNSNMGGKGAYATGVLNLKSPTTVYMVAGGYPTANGAGGFNGGGSRATYKGGGGGSDIRIGTNSLYARVIVAAGGGSDGATNKAGGPGGVDTSLAGSTSYGTALNNGAFGVGGVGQAVSGGYAGAGGGGWYGGSGCRPDGSLDDDRGGYGGTSYVYTSATAASYPSGCLLNSEYYLTDTNRLAGNASFTSYSGTTVTGNSGDGAVRITVLTIASKFRFKTSSWKIPNRIYQKDSINGWQVIEESVLKTQLDNGHHFNNSPLPYDDHTVLLLHGDDITDSSAFNKVLTNVGVVASSDQSKFGGKSLYFDGSSYLTLAPFNFSDKEWTIEWWEYPLSTSCGSIFSSFVPTAYATLTGGFTMTCEGSSNMRFYGKSGLTPNSSGWDIKSLFDMYTIQANTWTHRAVQRNGNAMFIFTNGELTNCTDVSGAFSYSADYPMGIGCWAKDMLNSNYLYKGYMDEFRISNIARYPVVLSNSHSTSFTANGTVGSVSEGPLQNSRALSMTNMYMDITHPDIPSLSTNNFTIDWWENRNFAAETNSNGHGLVLLGFNTDQTYAFLVGYAYNTSSVGTGYTSYISSNGTSWNLASQIQVGDMLSNQWVHRAVVRDGTDVRYYQNGVLTKTISNISSINIPTSKLRLNYAWAAQPIQGSICEFRLSNNVRWNNNFSVPTSPYELDNNTMILIHGGTTAQSAFATSPFST